MNWMGVLIVAVMGILIAGPSTVLLTARSPRWSSRKRVLTASLVAPVLILLGVLIGISMVRSEGNEMSDLARAAMISIGLQGALIAFVTGLAVSVLVERALKSS